jgi:hypothetical protein
MPSVLPHGLAASGHSPGSAWAFRFHQADALSAIYSVGAWPTRHRAPTPHKGGLTIDAD